MLFLSNDIYDQLQTGLSIYTARSTSSIGMKVLEIEPFACMLEKCLLMTGCMIEHRGLSSQHAPRDEKKFVCQLQFNFIKTVQFIC